jgi:two-component system sensor histidine kinase DesK
MTNIKLDERRTWRFFPKQYGIHAWIWLIYLVIPLYYLAQMPLEQSWIGYVLVVIFLSAYRQGYWDQKRVRIYIACLIGITTAMSLLYVPGYFLMMFFATYLIATVPGDSLKWVHIFVGSIAAAFAVIAAYYLEIHELSLIYSIVPSLIIIMVLPYGMRSIERARRLQKQLHTANEEIERLVKIQERQRIARDLHDTLGHTLSLITLKSELAEKMVGKDPERAKQEMKDIQATSRAALNQVRELVSEMQAISLESEIEAAGQLLQAAEIGFAFEGELEKLDSVPLVRNMLAYCLREAVNNVVKHSRAHSCRVSLTENDSQLLLIVRDDGIGMVEREDDRRTDKHSGRGLLGIKERLELVEGKLKLEHSRQGGTALTMIVPRIVKGTVSMTQHRG